MRNIVMVQLLGNAFLDEKSCLAEGLLDIFSTMLIIT